jgi:glycosyltransferase involved in cell wall biosynthesis
MHSIQVPRRFVAGEWGGTETVILETAKRLILTGHETEILCPAALSTVKDEVIQTVPVHRVPYFYPYFGLDRKARQMLDKKGGNLFSFELMKRLLDAPKLDVIHLHTGKRLGGIVRHAAKRRRVPYVITLHGGVFDVPSDEAASWTESTRGKFEWGKLLGAWVGARSVLEDAAAILCVGAAEAKEVAARYPDKRVVSLPNGVDTRRFAAGNGERFRKAQLIPPGRKVILTVGRIDPQKNQILAVGALRKVVDDGVNAHLVLIGAVTNSDYLASIEAEVKRLGLTSRVTVIPGIASDSQDLVDAFYSADVFLLPSRHEPFGIVVLEAWAAGRAVVASRVGGVPSFVEDGLDGILFDSGDACQAAVELTAVLKSAELAGRLGEAGQKKALAQYDWDAITSRLIGVYEEVIHANSLR